MSRNKFIGLIFMMVISISGIIWIQSVWIRNAVSLVNRNFNNAVFASLNNAAEAIESSQKMNFMFGPSLNQDGSAGNVESYVSVGTFSSGEGGDLNIRITNQSVTGTIDSSGNIRIDKNVTVSSDTTIAADSGSFNFSSAGQPAEISVQNGTAPTNPDGVYVQSREFRDWVKKRSSEFRNMSDKMISEVYQWEKSMDLNNGDVLRNLRSSFLYSGIETPFEFAIIKNGKVQEGTYQKYSPDDFLKSKYLVRLFPDNIIRQDLILSVIFPSKTNYVLGSMVWILSGSLLFSFIILATFAMSLFFIIRQKKISEMKSDFINNMTHEFKTPIATISLAADTIVNPKVISDESKIRHFISMIKKENSRMNKKVETILQIASLDKKEIDFKFENVSLHSVIERSVDTIEIQVQQKNGSIRLGLNAEEPVVYGDYEHLVNLVNNLLDNAIKYSPDSPEIAVDTVNNHKGVVLTVEDKGIGMTKSVQSKIFERFYRQSSGNIHDVKGFGLGLNYVRAIIDAHKGSINVTSEPGKGSRFEIFLPFNWDNQ